MRRESKHSTEEKRYILAFTRAWIEHAESPTAETPDVGTILALRNEGFTPQQAVAEVTGL